MRVRQTLLLLVVLLLADAGYAQKNLKVTLILVREQTVCRPDGYRAGEDDQNCKKLSLSTVQKWTKQWPTMQVTVKPGANAVALTRSFNEKLHSLVRRCWPPQAKDRWAVVVWISGAADGEASIERTESRHGNCAANGYSHVAAVTEGGNIINHQRADAFRPAMDAEWTITHRAQTYTLTIVRPTG